MRKAIVLAGLAVLALAPAAQAAPPTKVDRMNAAQSCKALRTQVTPEVFRTTFSGVNANGKNAFGKCVSTLAREQRENRLRAAQACQAE